jgi:hypothetical protein
MHQILNTILNGPAHYTQRHHLSPLMTLVVVLGCLIAELSVVWLVVLSVFKAVQNIRPSIGFLLRRCGVAKKDIPQTFLELTFPADTTKSAYATEQLHILLRGVVGYHGRLDRLAVHMLPYSLELVGTNDEGIRYVIRIPTFAEQTVRRNLLSYLPGLKIAEIDDYLPHKLTEQPYRVTELTLTNDFVLPLKDHKALSEHDPMAYLTGHMTKLLPGELIAVQEVVVPVSSTTHTRVLRRIRAVQTRIALGQELSGKLSSPKLGLIQVTWTLMYPFFIVTKTVLTLFTGLVQAIARNDLPESMKSTNHKRTVDPYEQELHFTVKTKLDQPLFEVSLRLLVIAPDMDTINERTAAIVSSFQPFASSHQSIGRSHSLPFFAKPERRLERFRERTLTPHLALQRPILSSSELADLYHFPNTDITKTEDLVKSRSPELPTPLSISRSDAKLDVIVGVNTHGGEVQPIGMTSEQRQKHTYVIGKTGMGKTTLLCSSIYQDMVNGKGLAVLDPHGDMFQELLAIVPEHRRQDVVVFDPSDRTFPLGLNLLDPGIEFEDEDNKQDRITSSVLSVFMKLADEDQWGPRMEHILRNATMTALQLPNPSLYTLQRLLTEKTFQKEVAETLKDPILKQFWEKEFKLLGRMQLSTVTAPLTNRLGKFITSKRSRHILLQQTSTLRVADIMNEGKILLVNLSKGQIGEDQSAFFGTILTSFIWMAAYQRAEISEKQRRDFFLYVDEFQNFASPDFSEIVSEGRKYHVSLVVSHQSISQIPDMDLLDSIAGNASTLICLKVGPKDEAFILPYMRPEVVRGDIVNLAPYHFYMKTTSDVSEDAFSGCTVPLDAEMSDEVKEAVIAQSQQQYGTPKATVEAYLETLFVTEVAKDKETPKPSASKKRSARKPKGTKGQASKKLHGG